MNAEMLYIVKTFLPEIALTALAVLVMLADLLLSRANCRKALALVAAFGCLFIAGLAGLQWAEWTPQAPGFVGEALPARVAPATQVLNAHLLRNPKEPALQGFDPVALKETLDQAAVPGHVFTDADARATASAYEVVQRAFPQELRPLNLGIGHPGMGAWWLFSGDRFAAAFKVIFLLAAFLVLLMSVRYPVERYRGEFVTLLLFATVGLMVMATGLDLVVIFLGLELAAICLYVLTAWHKGDAKSAEAGTKYLLLASLASAFFIYGASLLFVRFGSTHLAILAREITAAPGPLALIGLIMLLVGFAFKVAAAPFHLWAPDVYQGAPISTVAFLSTASKAAGFAVLLRVLLGGFVTVSPTWWLIVGALAALSILIGNLIALHQNNVKRLLAYSGIAQAGYILIGLTAMGTLYARHPGISSANIALFNHGHPAEIGVTAMIFYLFLYTVGNIGAFAVVGIVNQATGSSEMSAFAGLRWRAPVLAFAMALLLLSLGGIPMLAGFVGKVYLFLAAAYQGQYLLILLGAALSVVSIYYYLLIIKQMYILPAPEDAPPIRTGFAAILGLLIIVAVTLVLGIYPGPVLKLATATAQSLLGIGQ